MLRPAQSLFASGKGRQRLPVDLLIVRNGISEGLDILDPLRSESGRSRLLSIHASKWRLTESGREAARLAGEWIRAHFPRPFDAYLTGEYVRSLETAACLALPEARWIPFLYLRPRDFGSLSDFDRRVHQTEFLRHMAEKSRDSFYWTPPDGESIAHLTLRTERILSWIRGHVPPSGSALIVTHKDVMETIRVRIETISQMDYPKQIANPPPERQISPASIIQYTRRNPDTGVVSPRYEWMRIVTPWLGGCAAPEKFDLVPRQTFGTDEITQELMSVPKYFDD
jgi:broad specificity phosphatase PhoE